jgi:hypothetical protein
LSVAPGPDRAPGSQLAPSHLVAGVLARSPSEFPTGSPGAASLGHAAGSFCQFRSGCGLGENRARL